MATRAGHDRVLVLAAGRGTRMGTPKVLMLVGGEPWWVRQARRIDDAGLGQTWVVSESVRTTMLAQGAGVGFVTADAGAPMFESLVAGLVALREDPPRGVFVLPVDVPAPGRGVFDSLSGSAGASVPVYRGKAGHPVYLPWGWVRGRVLTPGQGGEASPLDGGRRRLDRLLDGEAVRVAVDDPATVVNLNTPGDLERWLGRA